MSHKTLLGVFSIFLILSLLMNFYEFVKIQDLESQFQMLSQGKGSKQEEEMELAEKMMYLQRYAEKLFWAGKNHNWPLADFYLEEMEETAEKVIQANKIEDEFNISSQMQAMLLPKIRDLQRSVKAQNAKEFMNEYKALLQNCNSCHSLTQHAFIQIMEPSQNHHNQQF